MERETADTTSEDTIREKDRRVTVTAQLEKKRVDTNSEDLNRKTEDSL